MGLHSEISLAQAKSVSRMLNTLHLRSDGTETYGTQESSLESYEGAFYPLLRGRQISEFVRDKNDLLVIDLMGSSRAMRELFQQLPGKRKRGIVVSLGDNRTDEERRIDEKLGIIRVRRDLSYASEWEKLKGDMGGQSADLILARPYIGIDNFPAHERYYRFALGKMWEFLGRRRAHILMQTPSDHKLARVGLPSLQEWVEGIREQGIEAQAVPSSYNLLHLVKEQHSLAVLPYK